MLSRGLMVRGIFGLLLGLAVPAWSQEEPATGHESQPTRIMKRA